MNLKYHVFKMKRKKSNDQSFDENIHKGNEFFNYQSKRIKTVTPSIHSYRDYRDNNFNKNVKDKYLPKSMILEQNKIIPNRKYHTTEILDNKLQKQSEVRKYNEKKNIFEMLNIGFSDVLPPRENLKLLLDSLENDDKELNNEKEKDHNNHENDNDDDDDDEEEEEIYNIEFLIDGKSSQYGYNKRLQKSLVEKTSEEYTKEVNNIRDSFFKNDSFNSKKINSNIYKSQIYKEIVEKYQNQYNNKNKINSELSSLVPNFSIPYIHRIYFEQFRLKPRGLKYGERECIKGTQCLFYTFQSNNPDYINQDVKYIGREFLLPEDLDLYNKNKKLPDIVGPCIDCLLSEWKRQVFQNIQFCNTIDKPINTFRVYTGEGEYHGEVFLPCILRNDQFTGIYGFVPTYSQFNREYAEKKISRKKIDGKHESTEIENVIYLSETNMDFH